MVFGGKPYKKYNAGIVPDQLSPHGCRAGGKRSKIVLKW